MSNTQQANVTAADIHKLLFGQKSALTGKPFSKKYYQLREQRVKKPVYGRLDEILGHLQTSQGLVVTGGTGSGKSTQIPIAAVYALSRLHEGGQPLHVACTQPRRISAKSVAAYVAQQEDVRLGEEVGYQFRGENSTSDKTILTYMTDGLLEATVATDDTFSKYGCIIIDEAHERTAAIDLLLPALKYAMRQRPSLRVMIMSATLDSSRFAEYLGDVPRVDFPGSLYPVTSYHIREPVIDFAVLAVKTVRMITDGFKTAGAPTGDILIFLPGEDDVEWVTGEIAKFKDKFEAIPLYGKLPKHMQDQVNNARKAADTCRIIVATNIAESSLKIPGLSYVVDSGIAKTKVYNPRGRLNVLYPAVISQASVMQRKSLCGRVGAGRYFAMYTHDSYLHDMPASGTPAILRNSARDTLLRAKRTGRTTAEIDWFDAPDPETYFVALNELQEMGFVYPESHDGTQRAGIITPRGICAARFPGDCKWYHAIITAHELEVGFYVCAIAACLSINGSIWARKTSTMRSAARLCQGIFFTGVSDHLSLMNAFFAFLRLKTAQKADGTPMHNQTLLGYWCSDHALDMVSLEEALNLHNSFKNFFPSVLGTELSMKTDVDPNTLYTTIREALAKGLFLETAIIDPKAPHSGEAYRTVNTHKPALLDPTSELVGEKPRWVVYEEYHRSAGKPYLAVCTMIEPEWICDLDHFKLENLATAYKSNKLTQDFVHKALQQARDLKKARARHSTLR
ncbi:P-loop containing nucleoside triphosphate hydrolase protein [Xylariomycetidae sp. FL0641]|nr:P-loop containing nucleoside triphosphate hydrolase protein [Xylariomycetidae sp. FL0641]